VSAWLILVPVLLPVAAGIALLLLPRIGEKLGSEDLDAVCGEASPMGTMTLGSVRVTAAFQNQMQPRGDGCCLCLRSGDELYLLGNACTVSLGSADQSLKVLATPFL
jgi:hypothetical protein